MRRAIGAPQSPPAKCSSSRIRIALLNPTGWSACSPIMMPAVALWAVRSAAFPVCGTDRSISPNIRGGIRCRAAACDRKFHRATSASPARYLKPYKVFAASTSPATVRSAGELEPRATKSSSIPPRSLPTSITQGSAYFRANGSVEDGTSRASASGRSSGVDAVALRICSPRPRFRSS